MKAIALFAAITLVVVVLGGWLFGLIYTGPEASRAVWTSAAVAFVVQLFGFAVVRLAARSNPIAGWGLGALLRFGVLAVYGLVVVGALGLASGPALLSLAAFFFVSTLVEPLLLNV
jgi:hypothetical protein